MPTTRKCPGCKDSKPLTEFFVRRSGRQAGHVYSYCKTCNAAKASARYYKNHEVSKANQRAWYKKTAALGPTGLRRYGLSPADYRQLLVEQNGVCAICGRAETASRRKHLAVDHNHSTGKIRGLLCDRCNLALGGFDESVPNLYAAIGYLLTKADDIREIA